MSNFDVVVPVLALHNANGNIDFEATLRYARRASSTWVDYFILSGSTAQGHLLSAGDRTKIIDLWLGICEPTRLLACCWDSDDLSVATSRGVTPMAVLQNLDESGILSAFRALPYGSTIYSHPMYGGNVFDVRIAQLACDQRILPTGGKLAKITTAGIREIVSVTDSFRLWDGSSRRIAASVGAGAAGIVATPLCAFADDLPPKSLPSLQNAVNAIQDRLDQLPTRQARSNALLEASQRADWQ